MVSESTAIKIILFFTIFISGFLGIITPRIFDPFGAKLSYANLVSCGVIISAALVHLLADASDSLSDAPLPKTEDGEAYPWAFVICGISFIFLFFFERLLVHQLLHHHHHHGHMHGTHSNELNEISKDDDIDHELHQINVLKEHNHTHSHSHSHSHSDDISHNSHSQLSEHSSLIHPHHSHHHGEIKKHAQDMLELMNQKNYFSAIVLLFGLGFHSILSGLAVGSSRDNSELIALGVAILSHKYLAAFALGVPLFKASKSLKFTCCIALIFALLTPIGMAIGLSMESTIESNPWIADIFICVASGTFLYVSICEIMIPEFSEEREFEIKLYETIKDNKSDCIDTECTSKECEPKQNDRREMKKMCCVVLGFGMMSILAIWV